MPNTAFTAHRQNIKVPLEAKVGISDSNVIHFGPIEVVFSALQLFQVLYHSTLGVEDLDHLSYVKCLVIESCHPLSLL